MKKYFNKTNMEGGLGLCVGLVVGAVPVMALLLWWWNELRFALPQKLRRSGSRSKLPPGHMGFPFLGEMLTFLWYFKISKNPDDFINHKRRKYGDGEGMYRSHLFGSPCIIACSPAINKFVFQQDDLFILEWPNVQLVGLNSLVAVQGQAHARLKSYVSNAINKPDALRRIAQLVQPRVVAALQSWAHKGTITAHHEARKVTFENIGKMFGSLEAGPLLDTMDNLFHGLVQGIRAQPFNFPGTAYHHALQCRKKLEAIFMGELEKKKKRRKDGIEIGNEEMEKNYDLMEGLMELKDEGGNKLSDKEVVDNIVSLVVAGYESTALASMWAIYYLAKFPNVLAKLREENMAIKQDKQGEFITSKDVSQMKYTNKVVEETIRMANVAAIIFRTATKDVEYKGYKIPEGWKVMLWVRYLHTNAENFDDPMCFNPDRWNNPAKAGTYQVFGGGRRICAGNMLARIQLAILLHHLSVGYKWELKNPNVGMVYLSHPAPIDGVEISFSKL